jgi:hypothetical protein
MSGKITTSNSTNIHWLIIQQVSPCCELCEGGSNRKYVDLTDGILFLISICQHQRQYQNANTLVYCSYLCTCHLAATFAWVSFTYFTIEAVIDMSVGWRWTESKIKIGAGAAFQCELWSHRLAVLVILNPPFLPRSLFSVQINENFYPSIDWITSYFAKTVARVQFDDTHVLLLSLKQRNSSLLFA